MAEADSALRDEIEKVRERARLQALAQGLSPDEAELRGAAAVEEFCAKWGIRSEMLGAAQARSLRPGAAGRRPGQPEPEPRTVDLGSSPLRSSMSPNSTQAIRIADLLKKLNQPAPEPPAPAPAAPGAAGAGTTSSNLSSLLQRVRTQSLAKTQSPAPPLPPPAAQAPAPRPGLSRPPGPSTPPSGTTQRGFTSDPFNSGPASAGGLTAAADRRRALIEEFDRTYAEVQSMLEQRIGVVDVAMNETSHGLSGAIAKAAEGRLSAEELGVLAEDVGRLRNHLQVMMNLCEEFLGHLQEFSVRGVGSPSEDGRP